MRAMATQGYKEENENLSAGARTSDSQLTSHGALKYTGAVSPERELIPGGFQASRRQYGPKEGTMFILEPSAPPSRAKESIIDCRYMLYSVPLKVVVSVSSVDYYFSLGVPLVCGPLMVILYRGRLFPGISFCPPRSLTLSRQPVGTSRK